MVQRLNLKMRSLKLGEVKLLIQACSSLCYIPAVFTSVGRSEACESEGAPAVLPAVTLLPLPSILPYGSGDPLHEGKALSSLDSSVESRAGHLVIQM